MDYDILIVGAGIAGLHCAMRIVNLRPKLRIAIAEAYDYVGGRIFTYTPGTKLHWESGAGRINTSHKMILSYIKKYGLTTIPIQNNERWVGTSGEQYENTWPAISSMLVDTLSMLSPSILATHTIRDIMEKVYGPKKTESMLAHFSYRAEVITLRADLALKSFKCEMSGTNTFVVVKEGLGTLITAMAQELEDKGVKFLLGHRLNGISNSQPVKAYFTSKKSTPTYLTANSVILALHSEALKNITPFSKLPTLKHLAMEPLTRTYGVFPKVKGKVWFEGLPKMVTDSPLRFIIPVNSKTGVIMTSYTDSDDTHIIGKWDKSGKAQDNIIRELRALLPKYNIPAPLIFKTHPWSDGCTYWLPGLYDPYEKSKAIMRPLNMPVYVCGESYSTRQAWIEGALEHAEAMLTRWFL